MNQIECTSKLEFDPCIVAPALLSADHALGVVWPLLNGIDLSTLSEEFASTVMHTTWDAPIAAATSGRDTKGTVRCFRAGRGIKCL